MNNTLKIHKVSLRNMRGESETLEGYVGIYEVIIDRDMPTETSYGTMDQAPKGSRHKLMSWDGEEVWYFGYRTGHAQRIKTHLTRQLASA